MIPVAETLSALSSLVGEEAARRFLASEPAPRRKRASKFAWFTRCVTCRVARARKTSSPECARCAGQRSVNHRWHPETQGAEARFQARFMADSEFRRVEGAAMAMRMFQIGMRPPPRMLEEIERRAGAAGDGA